MTVCYKIEEKILMKLKELGRLKFQFQTLSNKKEGKGKGNPVTGPEGPIG
jgi:hypothetical protein